jgi:hypothetical protein
MITPYSFPDNAFVGRESFPASCRQRIADLRQNVFLKLYNLAKPEPKIVILSAGMNLLVTLQTISYLRD